MDIGGFDITYTPRKVLAREHILFLARAVQTRWPDAVYEDGFSTVLPIADLVRVGRQPVDEDRRTVMNATVQELFFYENKKAADEWTKEGATDGNAEQLIYVSFTTGEIDFTVGSPTGPAAKLVNEVIEAWNNQPVFF